MGKNYYEILGLVKEASENEIKRAYRTMACNFHPECNTTPDAAVKFREAAEAYDVLSNSVKRDIFDKYGEEGLKSENPENGPYSFYKYHDDALLTFEQFIDLDYRRVNTPEFPVYLTLNEIRLGCTKQVTVCRKALQPTGLIVMEDKALCFVVKPGCKVGTKFIFKGAGNQGPNRTPADIIFVIRDMNNSNYKREGSNVIYTVKLTLKEALCGTVVKLPLLCGGHMSYKLEDEIITQSTVKTIQGLGLPFANDPSRNGDLILHFQITFPDRLPKDTKSTLSSIQI